jgi:hypothetical protein
MIELQIGDDAKYGKALQILYRMGGMFRTRPYHVLVVGPGQQLALKEAGLLSPNGKRRGGKKKKSA